MVLLVIKETRETRSKKLYIDTVSGPASYTTGGFNITVSGLRKVDNAMVTITGAYKAEVVGITGNTVKVLVRDTSGAEVTDATDLSGETITILVVGE